MQLNKNCPKNDTTNFEKSDIINIYINLPTDRSDKMKTTMGEKIKDLRVERHMTTKQLAQATGIQRQSSTAWRTITGVMSGTAG